MPVRGKGGEMRIRQENTLGHDAKMITQEGEVEGSRIAQRASAWVASPRVSPKPNRSSKIAHQRHPALCRKGQALIFSLSSVMDGGLFGQSVASVQKLRQSLKVLQLEVISSLHPPLLDQFSLKGEPSCIPHRLPHMAALCALIASLKIGSLGLKINLVVMKSRASHYLLHLFSTLLVMQLESALGFLAALSPCWFIISSQSAIPH